MKQQRRIFLQVLAIGPLVSCAGAGAEESLPGSGGQSGSNGAAGAVGNPATGGSSGGVSVGSGGTPATAGSGGSGANGSAGSPFTNGGNSGLGGNPFGSAGRAGAAGSSTGGSAVGSGGAAGGGSTNPGMVVGNVSEFPPGAFGVAGGLFYVGHDANGIYAMSMQCTHKFCTVVPSGNELDCPCHHSRFDHNGKVLVGPAITPLPHYAVYIDSAGNLSVDKYTEVSASARVAVPSSG